MTSHHVSLPLSPARTGAPANPAAFAQRLQRCPEDRYKDLQTQRHAPTMRQPVDNASFHFQSRMHAPARTTRTDGAPPHLSPPRRVRHQRIGIGRASPHMRSPGPQSFRSRTVRSVVPTPCASCRDASHVRLKSSSRKQDVPCTNDSTDLVPKVGSPQDHWLGGLCVSAALLHAIDVLLIHVRPVSNSRSQVLPNLFLFAKFLQRFFFTRR